MKELAIIIPTYNEELSIKKVIDDWSIILPKNEFDLIIIDDGSKDKTLEILRVKEKSTENLIVISKENGGHGAAICHGYEFSLKQNYKFIFQTDSDNQFFSSDFKTLWDRRDCFKYDIILGSRFKRNDPILRVFLSKFILRPLLKLFFKKNITDANVPYRLITSQFLKKFMSLNPIQYIAPNIIMTLHAENILFVNVRHAKRNFGAINWSLKKLIKFGVCLLKDLKIYYNSLNL